MLLLLRYNLLTNVSGRSWLLTRDENEEHQHHDAVVTVDVDGPGHDHLWWRWSRTTGSWAIVTAAGLCGEEDGEKVSAAIAKQRK